MPLTDVDAGQYKYDDDLEAHWQMMKDLIGLQLLQKQDSNDYLPSTPWVDWLVDLTQSNIHVLPMSDPIFADCLVTKAYRPTFDMPPLTKDSIIFNKAYRLEFECYYNGAITDNDLRDLTQHITGPCFLIDPMSRQVHVQMCVEANDTTDKVKYFSYSFDAVFDVPLFWTYINIETEKDGSLVSFAFHYELRDNLYENTLMSIEPLLAKQRADSPFAKCSLEKMITCERIFTYAYYLVPSGAYGKYTKIDDTAIHPVDSK